MEGPLSEATRLSQLFLDAIEDYAIFVLDPAGTIVTWNTGAARIKGYAASEIIGESIARFYAPEDIAAGKPNKLLEYARVHGRVEDEGWRVRKDGSRFWADVVITALRDGTATTGFIKITRDLTTRRAAESALRQSEASLNATLYSIGDGVIATDIAGRVVRVNPVAERLVGWTQEQAQGQDIAKVFNIINELTREPASNPVARVLAEGIVVGLANHTSLIARDGVERPIADSGAPIRTPDGTLHGAVLVFRDVSEERQAERMIRDSEAQLRQMIASVQDYAIFMLDATGHVRTWNPGAERIKGYTAHEIIGSHFSKFYEPADLAENKPATELAIASREGRVEDEGWRVRKDGSRFWANVVISAIRDAGGEVIGFTKITRDLTERRRAEQERIAQAAKLRERDTFLAAAHHELRTPLTTLILKLQGLEQLVGGAGEDGEVARRVGVALRQTDKLTELVERLLDVSRISAGLLRLERTPLDLGELLRAVIDSLAGEAATTGTEVRLVATGDLAGEWDRPRLVQVFQNLVSNAIKYGAGQPIDVTLTAEDGAAKVAIADRGIGIPPEDLARIFGRFERAAPIENYGGLGLGLFVAHELVVAHGGSIRVESVPDAGTTFTVTLPRVAR